MKKNKNKIISILLILSVIINAVIAPISAFAERVSSGVTSTTIDNTLKTLRTEARAAHTAYVFWKCVNNARYNGADAKGTNIIGDPTVWLTGSWTQGGTQGVGAWLEDKIAGKVEDGAIYCEENGGKLFSFFASQIGTTPKDLACTRTATPGMFYAIKDGSYICDTDSKTVHYIYSGWWSHVQKYYDDYAEKNGWKYRWADIASDDWTYPEVIGYTMYVSEVEHGSCKSSSYVISTPLDYVNEFGEITPKEMAGSDTNYVVPKTSNGIHHAFVGAAQNYTCLDMIKGKADSNGVVKGANPRAKYFQEEIFELIRAGCKEAYTLQYNEAVSLRDSGNLSDENKQKIESAISEYEAMQPDNFTEPTEKGGLQCKDTEFLTTVTQEDWTDDDLLPENGGEQEASCFDGTGVVGWIVCPIIEFLGDFIQGVYEAFIVPFLQLDVELFKSDSPIYAVWSNLRDVANLGFIIFFIIVIFSQLTGVGIDNYGIKKILPKLIMGAVLINLSFIICQLAVDLSNILGYSIENILDSWMPTAGQLNITRTHGAGTVIGSIALDGILLIGIVKFLVLPAVLAIGPEIWVAVLLAVITIAIAILFCFILLTVRKSFAVLLVIISPLAFMCYILPNTKGLFDKWFKTFKSVLLAFPICSAMIYGGQFVGRVLVQAAANNGGHAHFSVALSGAVISIVPIFLIPTVLRHSMGAIGAMMGRLQGGLTRAARFHAGNSGWAQEKKMQGIQYRNARRAGFQASLRDGSLLKDSEGKFRKRGAIYNRKGELVTAKTSAFYDENGNLKTNRLAKFARAIGGNSERSIAGATARMMKDVEMQPPSTENMRTAGEIQSSYNDAVFEKGVNDFMNTSAYKNFANGDVNSKRAALRGIHGTDAQSRTMASAFARAMASGTGVEKKALASMIQNGQLDGNVVSQIAGESSIRNAITDKGKPLVSKYMEAVSNGTAAGMSYGTWMSQDGPDGGKAAITQLAMDTDKPEDLASYDAGTFNQVINATTDGGPLKEDHSNAIISDELIQRTLDDKNLGSKLKSNTVERGEDGTIREVKGHIAYAAAVRGLSPTKVEQNASPKNDSGELDVHSNSAPKQEVKLVGRQAYYHKTTGEKVRGYQFSDGRVMIVGKDGKKQVMNQNDYVIVNQNPRDKAKDNPPPSGDKA